MSYGKCKVFDPRHKDKITEKDAGLDMRGVFILLKTRNSFEDILESDFYL